MPPKGGLSIILNRKRRVLQDGSVKLPFVVKRVEIQSREA